MRRGVSFSPFLALFMTPLAVCEPEAYIANENAPLMADANGTAAGCLGSCSHLLASNFENVFVHYPNLPADFKYFSGLQNDIVPACVVQPQNAEAVATVVKSVLEHRCAFAVKSGGHHTAAGVSNRDNGMVIDLRYLNHIKVSDDKSTVSVGPGNKWGDVYTEVESHGLSVVGGRDWDVGVGGFTLGGGISFLSRLHGWAMDNVRNFEVVLPNGTLANVNENSNPDLYFALRGGGSNFGIVTTFDFVAHKSDLIWGGLSAYLVEDIPKRLSSLGLRHEFDWSFNSAAIIATSWLQKIGFSLGYSTTLDHLTAAFVKLVNNAEKDSNVHGFLYLAWVPFFKNFVVANTVAYAEPVEQPKILQNMTRGRKVMSTNRLGRISDFAKEVREQSYYGTRHYWPTATFKVDEGFISKLWDIYLEEVTPRTLTLPEVMPTVHFQMLSKEEISHFSRNGGNAYGIDPEDGPLFFFSMAIGYSSPNDDKAVMELAETVMSRAIALGKELGLYHPFVYPNYAAAGQNVFAGFSPRNQQRLRDIQKVYDPERVFASLQPEQFRL